MRNRDRNIVLEDTNSFVSNPGDQYHITYEPFVNPDGSVTLKESGKDDIQAYIDSFRDSADINVMIARVMAGDASVLTTAKPMYGDFTNMPKTMAEALQVVMDAEKDFLKLPLDVRNKFDNDFRQYLATAGTDEWISKMNISVPTPAESEVKVDES